MAHSVAIAAAVAIGAAVAVAVAATPSDHAGSVVTRGTPAIAPAFSLPALARLTGRKAPLSPNGPSTVSLGAAGKPVLLSFFASWCTGCQQELRTMAGVIRTAGRSVEVVGVDVNDSPGAAQSLLAADHLTYPVGSDSRGSVSSAYGLIGLPTTIFLDARRRVVGQVVGPLSPAVATSWLSRLSTTGRG